MDGYIEYTSRPGHVGLTLITLGGLSVLAALFWQTAPGYVLLLLIPSILICMYQTVVTPTFGLRMGEAEWVIMDGINDMRIAASEIAYLRVVERSDAAHASVVLSNGIELDVPLDDDQLHGNLVADARAMGITVQQR